jgi:hypothetical protein
MSDQMLFQKRYIRSTEDEAVVEVEAVAEVVEATAEDAISARKNGVGGAAPIPTTLRTAGRRIATATNGHETVIKNLSVAINVENLDISEGTARSEERNGEMDMDMVEMAMEMKMEMEMEMDMDTVEMAMGMETEMEMETAMEIEMDMEVVVEMDKERASTDKVGMDPDKVDMVLDKANLDLDEMDMDPDNEAMDSNKEDSNRDKDRRETTDKS